MCLTTAMFCGPCEIFVEDDVENPVQPVLDAPMGADRGRERFGIELRRSQIISPLSRDRSVSLDASFEHADHGEVGEARLVGVTAIREQPVDLVADDKATLLDAVVIAVGGLVLGLQHIGWRSIEEFHDVLMEKRPIGLQRQ
ncbi:hypothetical protein SAMN05519104_7960 [Rhizobiales bacterium GAS188]|nr:hypothetical protein SAMN05519104_7960 [Rhizobiales bacterium GAS188]